VIGADADRCRVLLEDRDVHPQHAGVGDLEQVVSGFHGLAFDDHLLRDCSAPRGAQQQSARHASSRLEAVDLILRDVPQGETAPGARCESVVLQPPRQEVFLLGTHQIGRVECHQRVALLDALADVVRIQALDPAADPRVDVHEIGLGVLQYPYCSHRGSYRALGGPSKRDAEPLGFGAVHGHEVSAPPAGIPAMPGIPCMSGAGAFLHPVTVMAATSSPVEICFTAASPLRSTAAA